MEALTNKKVKRVEEFKRCFLLFLRPARKKNKAGSANNSKCQGHDQPSWKLVRPSQPVLTANPQRINTPEARKRTLPEKATALPPRPIGMVIPLNGLGSSVRVKISAANTAARNIRFRPEPGASPEFVHTLNGSALAVARLIVVLLETGYRRGEGIALPEILHPYLGFERLEPSR